MLPRLPARPQRNVLLTLLRGDNQYRGISLRGARDHVLDEVAMPRRINQRVEELRSLELLEGEVDRDPSLPLVLQLVEDPRILEGVARPRLLGLPRELLDHPLVDDPEVEEEMAHARGLAVVYVTGYNEIQVRFVSQCSTREFTRNDPLTDYLSVMGTGNRDLAGSANLVGRRFLVNQGHEAVIWSSKFTADEHAFMSPVLGRLLRHLGWLEWAWKRTYG